MSLTEQSQKSTKAFEKQKPEELKELLLGRMVNVEKVIITIGN